MEFYHPEDMSILKEAYEMIMRKSQTAGVSFFGKPYRMLTHNGCYITVETEWSSFVSPWSRHLKFVIGHHRVLKGPANPNVLAGNSTGIKFDEGVVNAGKIIQEEILKILTEPVHRPSDTLKQQTSKRCQVLASFIETLMDEVKKSGEADLKIDLPQESGVTFSELDSVMIGEVSPHHEYFDCKSSSEAPQPSYNQLNYSENLQRFFDSKPITKKTDPEQQELNDSEPETRSNSSPMQYSGESGCSESAGNMSSASHHMASITNTTMSHSSSYVPPTLTEALLCKHNEDMEKLIIKRHKFSRGGKGDKNKKSIEKAIDHLHGVKRSGSHSWEGEAYKVSKHQHSAEVQKAEVLTFPTHASSHMFPSANVDLWPPFSVSLTTMQNTQTTAQAAHFASNIFPTVYYIPQNIAPQDQSQAMQYMPSYLYQPIMYQHPSTFYQMQFQQTSSHSNMTPLGMTPLLTTIGGGPHNQRPASQATSAKADMGSIASASVVNRV